MFSSCPDFKLISRCLCLLIAATPACSGGPDTVPVQEVRLRLHPTALMSGVDQLVLRMKPTILRRADGTDTAVITDNFGNNGSQLNCTQDARGLTTCVSNGFEPFVNVYLIDALGRPNSPLGWGLLARNYEVPQGEYQSITVAAIGVQGERDSYVILNDGRECEVVLRSADGAPAIQFSITHHIGPNEDWDFSLYIDFQSTPLDPSQCASGYVLQASPARVEITPYQPA